MIAWRVIVFVLILTGVAAAAVNEAAKPTSAPPANPVPAAEAPKAAEVARPAIVTDVQKPTSRTKTCTDGGCHAKETNYKVLHGPTALGSCDSCHTYVSEEKHSFKLKDQGEALCNFCHVDKMHGKVTHKPVADGKCLDCHNPHGGTDRKVLRGETMADLCMKCHEDVTKKRSHLHGPVAAGSCAACHNAHQSELPKLLVAQGRALCVSCHDQMDKDLKMAKFIHKPVGEDCQKCHEVHASNYTMQLKESPLALCTGCHKDVKQLAEAAPHKHSAITTGDACLQCHTAHGSQLAKLMKDQPVKACMTCHDKKIEVASAADNGNGIDHVVPAMTALVNPKLDRHGPIRDGTCSGCHTVHGGTEPKLLAKAYPQSFYTPFAVEKYDLCFSCHDKQLVLTKDTKGLTNFRNGEDNLHFLHVNRDTKGRTCRACHETHASEHSFHIRESVPFGKWELPVGFKPTKSGGSCAPGCHKEKAYDRDHPVENPADPATPGNARPQPTAAAATK
jgi:predicted CXXCH cytochrome family protein